MCLAVPAPSLTPERSPCGAGCLSRTSSRTRTGSSSVHRGFLCRRTGTSARWYSTHNVNCHRDGDGSRPDRRSLIRICTCTIPDAREVCAGSGAGSESRPNEAGIDFGVQQIPCTIPDARERTVRGGVQVPSPERSAVASSVAEVITGHGGVRRYYTGAVSSSYLRGPSRHHPRRQRSLCGEGCR